MMQNAILIIQDQFSGFSHEHTNSNEYLQNLMIYIGNDPEATKNQRCQGSPFMTTDEGSSGWYYDERAANGRTPGYVWTYGVEAWCNLEG